MDESVDKPGLEQHNLKPRTKVIQPSVAMLKDVADNPGAYMRIPPENATSPVAPPETNASASEPQVNKEPFEPRSVYPEPKDNHTPVTAPQSKNNQTEVFNFSNGYVIGSGVYWFQLFAVVVLGLLLSFVVSPLLSHTSPLTAVWTLLLYYTSSLMLIAYVVPYRRFLHEAIDKPLWLTFFGATVQSFLITIGYSLILFLFSLLFRADLSDGVLSLFRVVGGGGLLAVSALSIVASFVIAYFATRVAWGVAFKFYTTLNIWVVRLIGLAPPLFIAGRFIYSLLIR